MHIHAFNICVLNRYIYIYIRVIQGTARDRVNVAYESSENLTLDDNHNLSVPRSSPVCLRAQPTRQQCYPWS